KKQRHISPFDTELRRRGTERVGERRMHWLHPRLMYRLFLHVWMKAESPAIVDALTIDRPIVSRMDRSMNLPESYVAMKWYFSTSLPDTPESRARIGDITRHVARRTP